MTSLQIKKTFTLGDTLLPTVDVRPFVPYVWERGRSLTNDSRIKQSHPRTSQSTHSIPHHNNLSGSSSRGTFHLNRNKSLVHFLQNEESREYSLQKSNTTPQLRRRITTSMASLSRDNTMTSSTVPNKVDPNPSPVYLGVSGIQPPVTGVSVKGHQEGIDKKIENWTFPDSLPYARNNSPVDSWRADRRQDLGDVSRRNPATLPCILSRVNLEVRPSPAGSSCFHLHRNRAVYRSPIPLPLSLDDMSPNATYSRLFQPTRGEMSLILGKIASRQSFPPPPPPPPPPRPRVRNLFDELVFSDDEDDDEDADAKNNSNQPLLDTTGATAEQPTDLQVTDQVL